MNKEIEIMKWSNPVQVRKMADKYFSNDVPIYLSNRKDKKYMLQNPDGKWIHFGQMNYEDFTKHKDEKRRQSYLSRTEGIKGDWRENKYSPNNLSRSLLW
jgi:hypothetical protein